MSTDTIPSPAAKTIRREIDSDSNGTCRVCGALREWICDEVAHKQANDAAAARLIDRAAGRGQGMIYLVMIDGSKLTDPQLRHVGARVRP